MGPGGYRDTREASWGVNFLSGTSTSLMSRSAMSASSKPLFQHSARHTQPQWLCRKRRRRIDSNDSLTFELGRRLNIGSRRITTRLIAAFLLGQGWNQHIFFFSSGLLALFCSSDALFCMYVWKQHFCQIFSCACCDHYPTTDYLLLSFNCRVLSFSRRGRVVIYECEREIHIND